MSRHTPSPELVAQHTIQTPLGEMLLARSPRGLAGAWFVAQRWHPGELSVPAQPLDPLLRAAECQLAEYFHGGRRHFELPLAPTGTPFQQRVWSLLLDVAAGTTCSYAQLAGRLGQPQASRAVGAAVGRNPVSVIVPCHRVVGSDGAMTGYAGGLLRKQTLLHLEQSTTPVSLL